MGEQDSPAADGTKTAASLSQSQQVKDPPRRPRRNFAQIHSRPLPVAVYPLPVFIPHNPLSWLHLAYTVVSNFFYPPSSHATTHVGYYSASTRSVHVTNPKHVRALWEMGFFGKGSLSRSEPHWEEQERNRIGLGNENTSEEVTNKWREERFRMKMERAKAEADAIEEQRRREAGLLTDSSTTPSAINGSAAQSGAPIASVEATIQDRLPMSSPLVDIKTATPTTGADEVEIVNQEHLQLSPEEAFFLAWGIGTLKIVNLPDITPASLLTKFRQTSYFPPVPYSELAPDDPFLLNYVAYHHFRSLGWVVRDGIKFAVDLLLYQRGPVFAHAAFAVVIIPEYSDSYWSMPGRKQTRTQRRKQGRDWTWLHCINRVQSHVVKTLVLVYVNVPAPDRIEGKSVEDIFRSYQVREFCIGRWSSNRNRE
jgi:tRNA-splicing endonuclease subunit Sen2